MCIAGTGGSHSRTKRLLTTLRIEIRPFGNGISAYTLTLLGVEGKQYSGERFSMKIEGSGT